MDTRREEQEFLGDEEKREGTELSLIGEELEGGRPESKEVHLKDLEEQDSIHSNRPLVQNESLLPPIDGSENYDEYELDTDAEFADEYGDTDLFDQ